MLVILASLVSLLSLSTYALASPVLLDRDTPTSDVCNPPLNASVIALIIIEDAPKFGWTPVLDDSGEVSRVGITMLAAADPPPSYWNITRTDDETYRIAVAGDYTKCVGNVNGNLTGAPCDSFDATWKISCTSCSFDSGSSCLFESPEPIAQATDCASESNDSNGYTGIVMSPACDVIGTSSSPQSFGFLNHTGPY
ncbi:hypothetical protein JCM1840_003627 [Sporobolomyces johnsonii]